MDVVGFQAFMKGQEEAFKAILPNCAAIDTYELHAELNKATRKMEHALHNMYPRNKPGPLSNSSTPVKPSAGASTPSHAVSTSSKPASASCVANSVRNSANSLERKYSATSTPTKQSQTSNNLPSMASSALLHFESLSRRASHIPGTARVRSSTSHSIRLKGSSTPTPNKRVGSALEATPNKPLIFTTNTPIRQKDSATKRVSQASRNIEKYGGASATFSRYIKTPITSTGVKHYISDSSSQAASDHELPDKPETLAVPKQHRSSKPRSQFSNRKETPVRKRSRNEDERKGQGVFTPMPVATKKPALSAEELNMAFLESERKKSLSMRGGESLSPDKRLENLKPRASFDVTDALELEEDTIMVEE